MRRLSSQRGITLLEVMVAVAITSIALVSLVSLVSNSLEMEEHARKLTEAVMLADDRMKEIERNELPEPGEIEGLINEDEPQGFAFREIVSDTIIDDVKLVEVIILWNNSNDYVTLSAYMLEK